MANGNPYVETFPDHGMKNGQVLYAVDWGSLYYSTSMMQADWDITWNREANGMTAGWRMCMGSRDSTELGKIEDWR